MGGEGKKGERGKKKSLHKFSAKGALLSLSLFLDPPTSPEATPPLLSCLCSYCCCVLYHQLGGRRKQGPGFVPQLQRFPKTFFLRQAEELFSGIKHHSAQLAPKGEKGCELDSPSPPPLTLMTAVGNSFL